MRENDERYADHEAIGDLRVASVLRRFIEDEVLPGTGVTAEDFWAGLSGLVADLAPRNRALLAERERLQAAIDAWHLATPGAVDHDAYETMLRELGYLREEPVEVRVTTSGVDPEISHVAGP
ncbi:MAG: malate synthase G, partial [Actinomycetota bacterium]|nr:malate synthase G [Actinomycetota bacterium]